MGTKVATHSYRCRGSLLDRFWREPPLSPPLPKGWEMVFNIYHLPLVNFQLSLVNVTVLFIFSVLLLILGQYLDCCIVFYNAFKDFTRV